MDAENSTTHYSEQSKIRGSNMGEGHPFKTYINLGTTGMYTSESHAEVRAKWEDALAVQGLFDTRLLDHDGAEIDVTVNAQAVLAVNDASTGPDPRQQPQRQGIDLTALFGDEVAAAG